MEESRYARNQDPRAECGGDFFSQIIDDDDDDDDDDDNDVQVSGVEDEEGIIEEDISNYTKSGDIYFKTIWKPRSSIFSYYSFDAFLGILS